MKTKEHTTKEDTRARVLELIDDPKVALFVLAVVEEGYSTITMPADDFPTDFGEIAEGMGRYMGYMVAHTDGLDNQISLQQRFQASAHLALQQIMGVKKED